MATDFFELSDRDQHELILAISQAKALSPVVIEKDIWLCLVLDILFQLKLDMSFKGGTSLSKVYGLIDRFSEDVDITIDHRPIFPNFDLQKPISHNALKKLSDELKGHLKRLTLNTIFPHMCTALNALLPKHQLEILINDRGDEIRIYYPSRLKENHYLRDHIFIELGIRNITEPNESYIIKTIGTDLSKEIRFPSAQVKVLSPLRTFWEKATLMHVECHRGRFLNSPERLSRHWYDLFLLARSWVGENALDDIALLRNVLLYKKAFFNASYAHYDHCLKGQFKLLPEAHFISGLENDYQKMVRAGMFSAQSPHFAEIISELQMLESMINRLNF